MQPLPFHSHPPVPSEFSKPDALLSTTIKDSLPVHVAAGYSLNVLGGALQDSYYGYPDIIRTLLEWAEHMPFDKDELLSTAVAQNIREKSETISSGLNDTLLSSPKTPSFLSNVAADPPWYPVFESVAKDSPSSLYAFHFHRAAALNNAEVPPHIFSTPADFISFLIGLVDELIELGDQATNADFDKFYRRVSTACSYDERTFFISCRFMYGSMQESKDPMLRSVLNSCLYRIRRATASVISHTMSFSETEALRRTVLLCILAESDVEHANPENALLKPIVSTIQTWDDDSKTQGRGRRKNLDKDAGTLLSIYGGLAGSGGDEEIVETSDTGPEDAFMLIRALTYPEMRESMAREAFAMVGVDTIGAAGGRRSNCLCLLLAYSAVAMQMSDADLRKRLRESDRRNSLQKVVKETELRIRRGVELCSTLRKKGGGLMKTFMEPTGEIMKMIADPTVAYGVIMWAGDGLVGEKSCSEAAHRMITANAVKHVAFMNSVILKYCMYVRPVMRILLQAVKREYERVAEGSVKVLRSVIVEEMGKWTRLEVGSMIMGEFVEWWIADDGVSDEEIRTFVKALIGKSGSSGLSAGLSAAFTKAVTSLLRAMRVDRAVSDDVELAGRVVEFRTSLYSNSQ